jgi:hypothetical protein
MFALNGKHAGQTRYNLTFLTVYVTRIRATSGVITASASSETWN